MEGAEQIAALVLGRSVQRRAGHHQRAVSDRAGRDPDLPVRDDPQRLHPYRCLEAPDAISDIEKFAFFMRFLAAPTPSPDTPGGATSIANGKSLFSSIGCAL